jgi:tetratricopeptide (TPR) repeat protein
MGVFAVRFYRTRIRVFWVAAVAFLFGRAGVWKPTSLLALGLWGAWELAQALMGLGPHDLEEAGGVAHWAHLGGLAFGAVVAVGAGLHRHAQDMYTREDAYRFFRRGDMKRAADCFAELLRETPDDADMRHKAGVAYELASHPSRAMPHYARAIELYAARGNVMDGARIFRRVARDPWVGQNLDAETFWLVADHLVERRALPEAVEAFAALATTRTGRGVAENAGLRCADLLLEEFRQPAQALEWYRFVRDKGRDSSNVERAARGAAAAERALAGK